MTETRGSADFEPAGLLRRIGAIFYDSLLLFALAFAVTAGAIALRGGAGIAPESVWFQLLLVAVFWLYFAWNWVHGGQTVGMRAWKIGLLPVSGARVGWRSATLRFVAAWLSAAPLGLGFVWGLFDAERRCWHDRWSGTRLVRVPPRAARPGAGSAGAGPGDAQAR